MNWHAPVRSIYENDSAIGRLPELHAPKSAFDDRDERRLPGGTDGNLNAKSLKHPLNIAIARMFCPQLNERRAAGSRTGRMRRLAPVDEEGHDAVGDHVSRVGKAPRQLDAVGLLATSSLDI